MLVVVPIGSQNDTESESANVAVPGAVLGGLMTTSRYGVTATLDTHVRLAKAVAKVTSQKQQVMQSHHCGTVPFRFFGR